jgi:predicted acylesterase/phospholipase RssA
MPIKILGEFITQQYLPDIGKLDPNHNKLFGEAQNEFTKQFDYLVGTSTGGLIAFCLAINYNILDMKDMYSNVNYYFKKNFLGPFVYSKYDPSRIHQKIDEIIDQIVFPGDKKISAQNATLLDIRNLLNPHDIIDEEKVKLAIFTHGNYLEFVDDSYFQDSMKTTNVESDFYQVKREKVLLLTAYNITDNTIMIFNTSYSKHWGYRIADVLKSTMAAPTYFPPQEVYKGIQHDGQFFPGKKSKLFIDGGVFANDPELAALWAIRMQWKKQANYHVLCIGTGCYTSPLSSSTWGGYMAWILDNGYLINTLMDATCSFTEIVGSNLAKFSNMRRMKLNYNITEPMPLDDPKFAEKFDREWEYLKNENDYKAFVFFYKNYIIGKY